jgi:hypothetical protein
MGPCQGISDFSPVPRLAHGAWTAIITALFMHQALRSSLLLILAVVLCAGCQTHDRRMYTVRKDKGLHTPDPWAPSTTKAADEATSSIQEGSSPGTTTPPSE